ncbi:MAG: DNA-3-methyladenine glycosylase I [Pseudomonadota bacterium]
MRQFSEIVDLAASRKGGREKLMAMIDGPKSKAALTKVPDNVWLAEMTRRVFQAGFNWSVIDKKWPGFETAFDGFDPARWAGMSDDDLDRLLADESIVRHAKKILSVQGNAAFILELAEEHGSAGKFFANSKPTEYTDLLLALKKRAQRMGGTTAQYFLRGMGVDSAIITDHVVKALVREGVVDKAPTSVRDLTKCQQAFNQWMDDESLSLTHVSRILAMSVDE